MAKIIDFNKRKKELDQKLNKESDQVFKRFKALAGILVQLNPPEISVKILSEVIKSKESNFCIGVYTILEVIKYEYEDYYLDMVGYEDFDFIIKTITDFLGKDLNPGKNPSPNGSDESDESEDEFD